jgi:DNA-binding transcriptional regulator YiaG
MKKEKRKKLEQAGWKVGDAADFLALSEEEVALIDMKISLSKKFVALRKKAKLTQVDLAKYLHTSQSRVAKMETGDPSVSIDLLVKGMIRLGASRSVIGRALVAS